MFEGTPTYPHAGRFWEMIGRHGVTVFYTAPTAIRSLIKLSAAEPKVQPKCFDLSSLLIIGTVGEPTEIRPGLAAHGGRLHRPDHGRDRVLFVRGRYHQRSLSSNRAAGRRA